MYNKSQFSKDQKAAKQPKKLARPKDRNVDFTGEGFLNPNNQKLNELSLYTDSIYNPTPYDLMLFPDNGAPQFKPAWDFSTTFFPGANKVTERKIQDGGYIETQLTDEEIQAYRDGGYVIEELPKFQWGTGGFGVTTPEDLTNKENELQIRAELDKVPKVINIKNRNEDVINYYKQYMESPRYKEMLGADNLVMDMQRKYNLGVDWNKTPKLTVKYNEDEYGPNIGGYSVSDTGDITILPAGYDYKGVLPHEWSHAIDRPGKFYKERVIPKKDIDYINKVTPLDSEIRWDAVDWKNYVSKPTEVRARLNDIRYQSKLKNIYDPFTQKVTPEIYKKLLNVKFETDEKEEFDALQELKGIYTDEQIMYMLNNISQKENSQNKEFDFAQNEEFNFAQKGGSIPKYQKAGETPNKILTLKDNSNWFDSRARYSDNQTYDDQIRERVYSGNWGYNPYTQSLHKLNTNQKTKPTEEQQLYKEDKKVVQAHLNALKNQDKKWWEDPSYKPTQKERDEFIKMGVEKTINNPAFTTAAYFTPLGMPIGAMQGAGNLIKDTGNNNLGWHSLLDAAMVAPAVGRFIPSVKQIRRAANYIPGLESPAFVRAQNIAFERGKKFGSDYLFDPKALTKVKKIDAEVSAITKEKRALQQQMRNMSDDPVKQKELYDQIKELASKEKALAEGYVNPIRREVWEKMSTLDKQRIASTPTLREAYPGEYVVGSKNLLVNPSKPNVNYYGDKISLGDLQGFKDSWLRGAIGLNRAGMGNWAAMSRTTPPWSKYKYNPFRYIYRNMSPKEIAETAAHETRHTLQQLKNDWRKSLSSQPKSPLGKEFENALVDKSWYKEVGELDAQTFASKFNVYNKLLKSGVPKEQALNMVTNPSDELWKKILKEPLNQRSVSGHFKPNVSTNQKINLLKYLPATLVGAGSATIPFLGQESNTNSNALKQGGSVNDYKIGDEVDEDTYLRLKELGYEFE